jgi:REP element-mobilizing transposase RayT
MIRERNHRLPPEYYSGPVIVAFTACVLNRARLFTDEPVVRCFEEILRSEAAAHKCDLVIYVLMPDHCHVLLRGRSDDANALSAMKAFKQKSGYWLSKNRVGFRWQKDFYDHILRGEEETAKHIRYILENPVRAGIVDDWKEYPFRGSTICNLDEWCE